MTDLPILYSFRRCPYAMRARMALIAAEIDVDHREVALRNKPDAMVLASPKATVPVLVLATGAVIDESLEIMDWALGQNDPHGWRNLKGQSQSADDPLIHTNDGAFKHHLDRMKYAHRYDEADPREHHAAAIALLAPLEARLADTAFLWGATPTISDIAIFPFIRQFARADLTAWAQEPLPHLQLWLECFINSDLFTAAMVKHPLWTASGEVSKRPR